MGTTVRCPHCKYENLAIDIWCARCGTPVEWDGTRSPSATNGNGAKREGRSGRTSGLAALAGGLPWRKSPERKPGPMPAPIAQEAAPIAREPVPIAQEPPPEPVPIAKPVVEAPVAMKSDASEPVVKAPPTPTPARAAAPAPIVATSTPAVAPASRARVFCPGCGQANEATARFCPRCGRAMAAAASSAPAATTGRKAIRRPPIKLPRVTLPRVTLPRVTLPRVARPRLRTPRIPTLAWASRRSWRSLSWRPLAYVLSPSGRHLVAGRSSPPPRLTRTGPPATPSSSALAAAIPGVEAKTGLKYIAGSCPKSGPCLKLASQSNGLDAAAVQFTTAGTGGRQCVGYVFHNAERLAFPERHLRRFRASSVHWLETRPSCMSRGNAPTSGTPPDSGAA